MEVVGSKGILWVTRCTGEMLDMPPLVLHTGNESVSYQLPMDWIESFNGAARDFVDGILTDRQPMMDIEFTEDVSAHNPRDVPGVGLPLVGGAIRGWLIASRTAALVGSWGDAF